MIGGALSLAGVVERIPSEEIFEGSSEEGELDQTGGPAQLEERGRKHNA